jgi:hypothetical protein
MSLFWDTKLPTKPSRRFVRVYRCSHCDVIFETSHIYNSDINPPYAEMRHEHKCSNQTRGLGYQVGIRYLEET